jgi:hypothetical protein
VELIGHTRTSTCLRVKAKLDARNYPTGVTITKTQMKSLALHPQAFMASGAMNCDHAEVDHVISISA